MSEVADACQIVLVSGRLIAVSAQLSLKMALLMMKIYNTLYLGKWKGNTSFSRFRAIKGDEYEFVNICTEDAEKLVKIEREMAAHNLLFARLPDLCGGDGNTQYVIARADMHIFAAFLMDHAHGELRDIKAGPISESDYGKTAVHPESGEYTKEFTDLNETAKEAWREHKEQRMLPEAKGNEKTLYLPLSSSGKVRSERECPGTEVPPAGPEADALMITRQGRREETSFPVLYNDPLIRLREEQIRHEKQIRLIFEDPVKEGEKWAAFPVHDGIHVVIIPKEDLLSGNTARKTHRRAEPLEKPPRAMLYTTRDYIVVDVRSGRKSIQKGEDLIARIKEGPVSQQRKALESIAGNAERSIGPGAVLPSPTKKHGR